MRASPLRGTAPVLLAWSVDLLSISALIVVTPNENAAATLEAPSMSLENLAREVLGEERIAHPVTVQHLLREAVDEVLGSARVASPRPVLRRALDHTGPASLPLGSRSSVATMRAPRTTQPAPTRKAAW